jgi:ParB family chromosome partitioning protein
MKIIDVIIENIHVGDRHRQEMGDMDALTANIREMGLLQPIGIDEYYNLIYGMRRLEACDNLGWKRIPCVVVKLKSLLAGQYAENEFRKQFTTSERTAIGKAIEDELGKGKPGPKCAAIAAQLPKGRHQDIAAKRAGFKSAETYDRAKRIADKGEPELREAVDKGEVSIAAGAVIASQSAREQKRIVKMPKEEQREIVQQIRKTRADLEADAKRAEDVRLFRGLYDAVKFIGAFAVKPAETWAGLQRVSAWEFESYMNRSLEYLTELRKVRPNEPKRPQRMA